MAAQTSDITLNPLPGSVLIPASRFTGTLICILSADTPFADSPVLFSASGDLTGDGYPEILITGWGSDNGTGSGQVVNVEIQLFSTSASGAQRLDPVAVLGLGSVTGTSTPRILDLDHNGLLDFFYLTHNENPFTPNTAQALMQMSPGHFVPFDLAPKFISHNSTMGDFNGDGFADVIAAGVRTEPGFFDPMFFDSPAILYINGHDGTFTPYAMHYTRSLAEMRVSGNNFPFYGSGSSGAMGDFDNDGKTDIVLADCSIVQGQGLPFGRGDTWLISGVTLGDREAWGTLTSLPAPYFEDNPDFASLTSFMGDQKSHDIKVQPVDIDNDGLLDILVSEIIWDQAFGTRAGVLQVLHNKGGLQFEDITDSAMYNFFVGKAVGHELQLLDLNGDGFLDIYMPEGDDTSGRGRPDAPGHTWANQILINTGGGKFVQAMWDEFHALTATEQALLPAQIGSGNQDLKYQLYVLPDGRIGFIKEEIVESPAGLQHAFFDFRADAPLSTGPHGSDPASAGAPGFSEYYYLTENPDVAAAVTAGTFASGLEHYLQTGRAAGRFAFAANAIIHGSAVADVMSGREGNETLHAGAGNDRLAGRAGNDALYGDSGLDTAQFSGPRSAYSIASDMQAHEATITDGQPTRDGADRLHDVERLEFSDISVALDLDGIAGQAARCIAAVFGREYVHVPVLEGIAIALLDSGMSYEVLMQLAIDALLGVGASHSEVAQQLFTNLAGFPAPPEQLATIVAWLDDGVYTVGGLGVLAAFHPLTDLNIDFTGLTQTGLDYVQHALLT